MYCSVKEQGLDFVVVVKVKQTFSLIKTFKTTPYPHSWAMLLNVDNPTR
jgi:hypothetical protein